MNTITVSATKFRNELFSILDQVALGMFYKIKKDGVVVAEVKPISDKLSWEERKKELLRVAKETKGAWKNVKWESPLRTKWAMSRFGNWDKK